MSTSSDIYWIVITGANNSGQTTFVQTAAERAAYRDRRNMSLIPQAEYNAARDAMQSWSARFLSTGDEGDPTERDMIDRYQNSLLVGELTVDRGTYVCLYESSPSTRFDASWESLQSGLLGVVIMMDSTTTETFNEVQRVVETIQESEVPYVVAANKQDLPDAVPADDIRVLLNLQTVPIVPCIANERDSVKQVLITLLHRLQASASA